MIRTDVLNTTTKFGNMDVVFLQIPSTRVIQVHFYETWNPPTLVVSTFYILLWISNNWWWLLLCFWNLMKLISVVFGTVVHLWISSNILLPASTNRSCSHTYETIFLISIFTIKLKTISCSWANWTYRTFHTQIE